MSNKAEGSGLIPKLRFPAFRAEGEWEEKKLGELATFFKGKGLPKSVITPNGKSPCIHYGELFTEHSEVIRAVKSYTNLDENIFLSVENDVLMPTSDVSPRGLAKACCIKLNDVILGGDVLVIRTSKESVNGEFLARYIRHLEQKVLQLVSGTTVFHLYATSIDKLVLSTPQKQEQQKIADCFASLDERITLEAQKLDTLKSHKKGLMQQLFPAEGETLPKLRFPEFRDAGEWEEKRLGDVGNVRMCKRILKEQTSPRGDIPFYKIGTFGGVPDAYISREIFENFRNSYPFPKNGAVLISAAGTIGRTVRYNGELAYFQDSNIVWLDNSEKLIADNFLFYLYQLIDWSPSVGAIQRLYNENILGAQVKFPSIPEQQKIADCLATLDDLITAQTQKLAALKTHKKGLMQQLFPSVGGVAGEA